MAGTPGVPPRALALSAASSLFSEPALFLRWARLCRTSNPMWVMSYGIHLSLSDFLPLPHTAPGYAWCLLSPSSPEYFPHLFTVHFGSL